MLPAGFRPALRNSSVALLPQASHSHSWSLHVLGLCTHILARFAPSGFAFQACILLISLNLHAFQLIEFIFQFCLPKMSSYAAHFDGRCFDLTCENWFSLFVLTNIFEKKSLFDSNFWKKIHLTQICLKHMEKNYTHDALPASVALSASGVAQPYIFYVVQRS